jgi:predicted secreted acid phosphatase
MYNTSLAERDKLFEQLKVHFGHDWIVFANPAYGSLELDPKVCGIAANGLESRLQSSR